LRIRLLLFFIQLLNFWYSKFP